MGVNELTQLINGCGFPIAACAALFWLLNTSFKELTVAIDNLGEKLNVLVLELRKDKLSQT